MTILQDQKMLSIILPVSVYITLFFNKRSKSDVGTFLNKYEKFLTKPIVLTTIALITNIIGGYSKPKTPLYIERVFSYSIAKYIGLVLVTFTLTRDIELAVTASVTFLLVLQMLRSKDEKEEYPYLI